MMGRMTNDLSRFRSGAAAAVVLLAGLVGSGAVAQGAGEPARRAPSADVSALKVPHVAYRERRLGNGLQVLSIADRSSPTVDACRSGITSAVATTLPAAPASRISSST